jgi:hypothetical protein
MSHVPPHSIAFMRIIRLLEKAVFREYKRIIADNLLLYGSNFVSTNSDFYMNSERRESFGCLVANTLAQRYIMEVRRRRRLCHDFIQQLFNSLLSGLTVSPCTG